MSTTFFQLHFSEYKNGKINKQGHVRLNDTQCCPAKTKEKLYLLNDLTGLYFDVKPNGTKAWRYWFKLNGKSSMFALGGYPMVKLAEDREKLLLGCSTKSLLHHLVYLRDQRHIPIQK